MASYKFLGKEYTQHNRGILGMELGSDHYNLVSQYQVSGGPTGTGYGQNERVFSAGWSCSNGRWFRRGGKLISMPTVESPCLESFADQCAVRS